MPSGILQALEFLHFMLRLCRLALFAIERGQSEMRLRRQRTLLLNRRASLVHAFSAAAESPSSEAAFPSE